MHPHPPPYTKAPRYSGEYYYEERPRGGNPCLKCICCCYCILFFIILLVSALAFYFYTVYQPKLPHYNVEALEVKEFGYQPDFTLTMAIIVTIKAENPNKAIELTYGEASSMNVTYTDSTLCSGKLPAFHQGHKNTTIIQVELKGKSQFGSGLYEAMQENEKNGKVPLLVIVKVPVEVLFGTRRLKQFNVLANCSLIVNNLKAGKKAEIVESKFTYKLSH
ncbi:NDR1/HIN1-like protein 6 [Nicotiana tabacum]|uniref:NDR1/HIN1-like protein 6 n=1 Tax=Nicotiana tabacum TaxID=4097 RepID=A0A1S4C0Y3_TOBAC|nr:NDR1/HIN1-like protein 6 [Nicotiana tomentosiformis]XP_016494704.1 PREDICTED: protein YLS9-like [Nicotiana tabacum]